MKKESIREIAQVLALADIAARTPREFNPHIPMVKDELYSLAAQGLTATEKPTPSQYVFFAGANGSGKTSFIRCMKNTKVFSSFHYICADEAESDLMHLEKMQRMQSANMLARNYRNICLERGENIIYESVASHPSHLQDLSSIASRGANVTTVFITTESHEINLARIALRKRDNDSYLTPDRVLRRRERSLKNLIGFINASRKVLAFDNSVNYKPVFVKTSNGDHFMLDRTAWADKYIREPLLKQGVEVLTLANLPYEQYIQLLLLANEMKENM